MMRTFILFVLVSVSLAFPINSTVPGLNSPHEQKPLLENSILTPKPVRGLQIEHGMFIERDLSTVPSNSSYIHALKNEQSVYRLLERYSDELYAVSLLLLVPIALGIVELAERLSRSMSVEQFPERGREKRRLESLKEREQWVLKRKEREMKIKKSQSWWKWSRH
ncbi:hypothetical protein BJY01DRAFT_209645 [Aspergillus pseudoustus]|uniref:Transmembrane protein n=1 Tax=Aspergillus pseudoustus TaxID=1810923 RepID=A0ABR4KEP6_9EURO